MAILYNKTHIIAKIIVMPRPLSNNNCDPILSFFSLGKANRGAHRCHHGGLGRAAEGSRPSVQAPGFEPGQVHSAPGSRTSRATLSLQPFSHISYETVFK